TVRRSDARLLEPERLEKNLRDLVLRGLLERRENCAKGRGLDAEERGAGRRLVGRPWRSRAERSDADHDPARAQRLGERGEIRRALIRVDVNERVDRSLERSA